MSVFVSPEIYYGALCLMTFAVSALLATVEYRGGFLLERE